MKQPVHSVVPTGAYSSGIVAEGRFLYVSGQGPLNDGVYVPGTIDEEAHLALANVR